MGRKNRNLKDENFDRHRIQKINEIKFYLCHQIDKASHRRRFDYKMLAEFLGTSQGAVSRVVNKRIDDVTVNQLFNYLTILEPNFELLISF